MHLLVTGTYHTDGAFGCACTCWPSNVTSQNPARLTRKRVINCKIRPYNHDAFHS